MTAEEKTAVSARAQHDDLEAIEGVGPGYAKALNQIGIYTYHDLAKFDTPDDLHEALSAQDETAVPLWKIENAKGQEGNWLEQAQLLAEQTSSWQEHAYFSLKFEHRTGKDGQQSWRTWVYREQNGGLEGELATDPASWANWILDHANLPFAENRLVSTASPAAAAESATAKPSDAIELTRGEHKLTFKKVPNAFAVRLRSGQAANEAALESTLGSVPAKLQHLESKPLEQLDVYQVETAVQLEGTMDTLRKSPEAEVVTHLYEIDDTPAASIIPIGSLTLQFKNSASKAEQEATLAEFGLEIIDELDDFLPGGYTVRLTDASTENPLKIAAKLQERDNIIIAEPDIAVPTAYEYAPTDTLYTEQWHLNNQGDRTGLKAGADVKAEAAWERTLGKQEIKICVMDDGFDLAHPEFDIAGKIAAPRDFGQDDLDPSPVATSNNHGTACAGVALAAENGQGVVGLAPRCTLMPVRMANLSDNAVVAYFRHAIDNGADIISCSWSARPWNFPLSAKMHAIIRAAATQGRQGKGCIVLFAAGNQNRPLDGFKDGHRSHQGFALHPDVLAIGASNSLDERANYSNFGTALAICAPSSGSPGRRIVTTDRQGARGYAGGDYTNDFGGTSSATPLAAGLAALILSVNPELTAAEVKEIMKATADKIDRANGNYIDGHSESFGYGRINAQRAIERAVESLAVDEPPPDVQPPVDDEPDEPDTSERLDITVSISQFLVELSDEHRNHLQATVTFEIVGEDTAAITAVNTPYKLHICAVETEQSALLVGSREGFLQPNQAAYTNKIHFPFPPRGNYTMRCQVTLLAESGQELTTSQDGRVLIIR